VPVGRYDVCGRCIRRAPGGATVGAEARLPVEREDMCWGRWGRARGGPEVGGGARLSVEPWDVCIAAEGGHLQVLKLAREHDCPWDEQTCEKAAEGGHLEVLKWAREHDCPWNEDVQSLLRAVIWRCCGGRGRQAAPGVSGRVPKPL
jgi:hypothetical protein